jgi:hypothetical protein
VTQNFSTADAIGRLTLNMLMSFAEFEGEMIAERIRDKIASARRKGKATGGPVPMGCRVRDKRLVVNDSEAAVVQKAFELLLQHRSIAAVTRALNDERLFPKLLRPGAPCRQWGADAVAKLLRNPLYAALLSYREERHDASATPHSKVEVEARVVFVEAGGQQERPHCLA